MDEKSDRGNDLAIVVENAEFGYKKNVTVLNQFNLTAKRGEILALLGPNGVGKTTIIKAILGRIKLESGSIRVFGHEPGSQQSDIPGPGAGYMPQELALFEEFTIEEILKYYGTIYHLKDRDIESRVDELIKILNLPEKQRLISRLSGGQKRRVSIAVTMIHRPKLIILDEPTVGVDSLLRKRIWNYLEHISQIYGQTTIITTHYIEEARSADTVAFMNYGKILCQAKPEMILQQYNSPTLENVFLILCQHAQLKRKSLVPQKTENDHLTNSNNQLTSENMEVTSNNTANTNFHHGTFDCIRKFFSVDTKRVKAMNTKQYLTTIGRPMYLFIYFTLLPLVIILCRYATGHRPTDNPIALFNADSGSHLSHLFVESLDLNFLKVNEFFANETAFESVVSGQNIVSVVIPENFSDNFESLILDPLKLSDEEIEGSRLRVSLDSTNVAVTYFIQAEILRALFRFLRKASVEIVHYDMTDYFNMVKIQQSFFMSHFDLRFDKLLLCGLIVVNLFACQLINSVLQLLEDKKSSSFSRIFVAGVTPSEFLIAQVIKNVVLCLLVVLETIVVAFIIFDYPHAGSYLTTYGLLFMVCLQGIGVGVMLGIIIDSFISGGLITAALYMGLTLTSGVFWPIEAIPWYFVWFVKINPITPPNLALQHITHRGWSIASWPVFYGFLSCAVYSTITILISYLLLKLKPKD